MFRSYCSPFIRAIASEEASVSGSASGEGAALAGVSGGQSDAPNDDQAATADGNESETKSESEKAKDPNARGFKVQVLKDLSRERDNQQAAERERDAVRAKLEEFERAQMSEQERAIADRDRANARVAQLEAELEAIKVAHVRQIGVAAALNATGLPAEMAEGLRGENADELLANPLPIP